MGKLIKVFVVSMLLLTLILPCYAADYQSEIDDFLQTIPDDTFEITANDLQYESLLNKLNFENIINSVFSIINRLSGKVGTLFFSLLTIIIMFQLVNGLNFNKSETLNAVISSVGVCAVIAISFDSLAASIKIAEEAIEKSAVFSTASATVVTSLGIASGKSLTGSLYASVVSFLYSAFQYIAGGILLPFLSVYIVLGIADNYVDDFDFTSICNLIKKIIYIIIIGFISVFTLSMSVRNILSASGDGFVKKSIQVAVSKLIPVIGGTLSGGLETMFALAASAGTLVCVVGMIVISVLFAPAILGNLIYGWTFLICKYISNFFGLSRLASIISVFSDVYIILTAVCSGSCFLLIASFAFMCINLG